MIDTGFGVMRYREGFEPHGVTALRSHARIAHRQQFREPRPPARSASRATPTSTFPRTSGPARIRSRPASTLDHIGFDEFEAFAPINYLREDRTLLRRSTFPSYAPFSRHNVEVGAYVEDRWTPRQRPPR